jgi:DNA-binding beta-propeller fold protein YncE
MRKSVSATGNEDDGLVYLGVNEGVGQSDYVATVRAQDDSLLVTTTIGMAPYGIVYYDKSGLVYCASGGTNEVCVLPVDGARVLTTLPVGAGPFVFAIAPLHNRLYLGHLNTKYVYVLRDTSTAVAEPQPARLMFGGMSVTPNPFTKGVAVIWNAPALKDGRVVRVFAQDGRLVRQVQIPAGERCWVWDGCDGQCRPAPPGVYVVATPGGVRVRAVKLR